MFKIKFITTLLLVIATVSDVFSQLQVYEVRGCLVDPNSNPVPFAQLININKRAACISDSAGYFRILMLKTDTVKISCLGFETTGFSLQGVNINDEDGNSVNFGLITLKPKVYEHETVNVYSERWKSFLYDYEQIEVAEEPYYVKQIENWKKNLISTNELQQLATAARGGGFSFPLDVKRRKAIAKIKESKRQDELNKEAYEKYNPTIISDITGLTIEESQNFMQHFNLDRDFILHRNDYELVLIIKQLFSEYNK